MPSCTRTVCVEFPVFSIRPAHTHNTALPAGMHRRSMSMHLRPQCSKFFSSPALQIAYPGPEAAASVYLCGGCDCDAPKAARRQ